MFVTEGKRTRNLLNYWKCYISRDLGWDGWVIMFKCITHKDMHIDWCLETIKLFIFLYRNHRGHWRKHAVWRALSVERNLQLLSHPPQCSCAFNIEFYRFSHRFHDGITAADSELPVMSYQTGKETLDMNVAIFMRTWTWDMYISMF